MKEVDCASATSVCLGSVALFKPPMGAAELLFTFQPQNITPDADMWGMFHT